MLAAALLLALAAPRPSAPDVTQSLVALSAPRADERGRAERWLAAHLAPQDFDQLAAFLPRAEYEPRLRLADALGADDRHFDLARRLALGDDVAVRECGLRAMRALVERWLGAEDVPPADEFDERRFSRDGAVCFRLALDERSLEELVGIVTRCSGRAGATVAGGETLPIAIDAGLAADAERSLGSRGELVGRWGELLQDLARRFDAHVWLYGGGERRAFAVLARAGAALPRSATEWILLRTRVALESPDAGERERAARALVGADFAPALELVARRWADSGDPALLSALALAASQGRVALELVRPEAARALARRAEAALAERASRSRFVAAECARALAGLRDATDGSRPLDVLAEGLSRDAPELCAWRFTAARLARVRLEPLDELARALVAAPAPDARRALAAAAAFEYLASHGALAGATLAAPRAWLDAEAARGRGSELVAAWARAGLALPAEWRPSELAPELALAVFAAGWDGLSHDETSVERFLAALSADLPELASSEARLEEWRQGAGLGGVAALVDAARARVAATGAARWLDALDRLDARLGRLAGERASELAERWLADPQPDWGALGALALSPVGPRVRERLLAGLASAEPGASPYGGLGRGVERALGVLHAADAEDLAAEFLAQVETRVRARLGRFREALEAGAWPRPPSRRPIDLARRDLPDGL